MRHALAEHVGNGLSRLSDLLELLVERVDRAARDAWQYADRRDEHR